MTRFASSFLFAVALIAVGWQTATGQYTFTSVADNFSGPYGTNSVYSPPPSINSHGTAVFYCAQSNPFNAGFFTGNGGALTTIASAPGPLFNAFTLDTTISGATINSAGRVAFFAKLVTGQYGIFSSDGTTTATIAQTGSGFKALGSQPWINDEGTVAFGAASTSGGIGGVYTANNGAQTTVAETGEYFSGINSPSINGDGQVAFHGTHEDFPAGTTDGFFSHAGNGGITPIVLGDFAQTLPFQNFYTHSINGPYSINAAGRMAFWGIRTGGERGIYTSAGSSSFSTIAIESSGTILDASPCINGLGEVAFIERINNEQTLWTSYMGIRKRVIGFGDPLFYGLPVTQLGISKQPLNDAGQIAFSYTMQGGLRGIAIASPTSPTPLIETVKLQNGSLNISFKGKLQYSANLSSWMDVSSQPFSPYVVPIAALNGKGFFRAVREETPGLSSPRQTSTLSGGRLPKSEYVLRPRRNRQY